MKAIEIYILNEYRDKYIEGSDGVDSIQLFKDGSVSIIYKNGNSCTYNNVPYKLTEIKDNNA